MLFLWAASPERTEDPLQPAQLALLGCGRVDGRAEPESKQPVQHQPCRFPGACPTLKS